MVKIPVTVEGMAKEIKDLCNKYLRDQIDTMQLEKDLNYLRQKRPDLFTAAITIRWIGKKRIKLVATVIDNLQMKE